MVAGVEEKWRGKSSTAPLQWVEPRIFYNENQVKQNLLVLEAKLQIFEIKLTI